MKTIKGLVFSAIMCSCISVCSLVSFPVNLSPVPVTMQSFAVVLCSTIMAKKGAVFSVIMYLTLGMVGVPIFAGYRSGIGVLLGPTGGFLVAFIISSYIGALILEIHSYSILGCVLSVIISNSLILGIGALWFAYWAKVDIISTMKLVILPFIPGTLFKSYLNILIYTKLKKYSKSIIPIKF